MVHSLKDFKLALSKNVYWKIVQWARKRFPYEVENSQKFSEVKVDRNKPSIV